MNRDKYSLDKGRKLNVHKTLEEDVLASDFANFTGNIFFYLRLTSMQLTMQLITSKWQNHDSAKILSERVKSSDQFF